VRIDFVLLVVKIPMGILLRFSCSMVKALLMPTWSFIIGGAVSVLSGQFRHARPEAQRAALFRNLQLVAA
jgi:hypothetical protein